DFNHYLATRRAAIDRALDRYVGEQQGQGHVVWRAMRYGLFPGGKRIRPILTLAAGELFGAKHKLLMPFACALEMIHAYSIIHDDLPAMDDDDLRRGEPTAHRVFGEGMALLAGDGLLTEAFHIISAPQVARSVPSALVLDLIHEIGHAIGAAGLVGGQAFDLEAENKEVDLATVEYIHVRKTGALILTAIRVGARAAGAKGTEFRRGCRASQSYGSFCRGAGLTRREEFKNTGDPVLMARLLDGIEYPRDVRKLTLNELPQLATEIREEVISVVSEVGGHLASTLGAVELTLALHYVFKTPEDRIVWDTGHQAYAHKLICGRRKRLATIRQLGGVSGFLSREESEYDVFGAGHAGTSISAALGM